jgi:hypothetical protein
MPETGIAPGPYTNQRTRLLRDFDKSILKLGRRVLEAHYSGELVDTVLKESRREYEALIPMIPDIGGKKNPSETNLIKSAQSLALYRALKSHGKTAGEAGRLIYEFVEAQLNSLPRWILLLLGRWRFTRYNLNKLKKQAVESQKRRYPEDWVFTFLDGDGKEFDFGRDYSECAIYKFLHAQGADELVPYLCRTEFAVSRAFGMGLVRTMTIAEGGKKCDPRFKRGRETKYVWP